MGDKQSAPRQLNPWELARLADQLATRSYQRADPLAQAVLEALEIWCQLAENLASAQNIAARQQIARYMAVIDRMRAITAGIQLADRVPGGGNGRTERPDGG